MGKILLEIGTRSLGLFSVILALAAEELLDDASETIDDLLLVELAKSLNWIVEDEFEDVEVILSVF
ncbi:MAG: hypothetical protein V7L11_10590 [Nostoc sp.]